MSAAPHQARWSSGVETRPAPNVPTEFECLVHRLGLEKRPDLWSDSRPLCEFAKRNKSKRYVPESFLAELGLSPEVDL